jgi:hypothetical protein
MFKRERIHLCDCLINEQGEVVAKFDLSTLDILPDMASAFLRAHAAEYGHTSIETQKQAHRCVRKLILCLQELDLHRRLPLPESIATTFHKWIGKTGLATSTAQSHQNIALAILRWCARNIPGMLPSNACLVVSSFVRNVPAPKRTLGSSVIREVLAACYADIESLESRIMRNRKLVDEEGADPVDALFARTVRDLLRVGKGRIPGQKALGRSGLSLHRRVADLGGLTEIVRRISVTIEDILPFYLVVLIQTGGNPMAVRSMQIDCISTHPLRDDLECLTWPKPRANREQRVDFPVGKAWSAPNLIRKLMKLNDELRPFARVSERNCLFLARNLRCNKPTVPSHQSLHNYLAEFASRHELPEFDFKDWRSVSAWEHYREGRTLRAAQRRLNHANIRTTAVYIDAGNISSVQHSIISKFQGELIRCAIGSKEGQIHIPKEGVSKGGAASTVFGFECKDPFAGLDGTSPIGSRCMNFTKCSTCPGALVPLDDTRVVARILAAKLAIEKARGEAERHGWIERYNLLYADTLLIITDMILPAVSQAVRSRAQDLVASSYVPNLE